MDQVTPKLPWTGERYVPELGGTIGLEHLHRYAIASEFVKEKRVLDIACGEGYGSEMLAKTASSVIGVDIDPSSISHAQCKYKKLNLSFKQGSCIAIPLEDHSVDVVISFETIEHIAEHEKMLSEIKRVLTLEGILIISSPEKHEYTEVPDHHNQFHVKELYSEEFKALLEKHFKNYKVLGQRVIYGSAVFGIDKISPFRGVYDFNKLPDEINRYQGLPYPLYLIAACSNCELPPIEASFCEQPFLESDAWKERIKLLQEKTDQLLIKDIQIQEKEHQIQQKDLQIEEKANQLEKVSFKINQLELKIKEHDIEILEKEKEILKKDTLLIQKDNKILEKDDLLIEGDNIAIKVHQSKIMKWLVMNQPWWKLKQAIELRKIAFAIARSGLFDREWYLKQNPDVARSGMNSIIHYLSFGEKEGRDPNPLFHSKWYLNQYRDVKYAGISPLWHYIQFGWKEGRLPNEYFNPSWYLKQNKDVAAVGCEPLLHYQKHGWKEGRSPNQFFDLKWYLEQHPELIINNEEPLCHYIKYGNHSLETNQKNATVSIYNIIQKKYGLKTAENITCLIKNLHELEKNPLNKDSYIKIIDFLTSEIKTHLASAKNDDNYDVSIVIPVHNQLVYTLSCIASILQSDTNLNYEILIGDDASTDNTKKTLTNLHPATKIVHNANNLGFLKNSNSTAQEAKGKYIVFLNNDTLVLPGWLDALIDIFNKRPNAGLVGAKLLNPDGTLQEAGGIIWKDGTGWNYGRGDDESKSEYNYVREVDYCSGACLVISKELWNQLEGFDERYSPAYYEDTDLAFRVRKLGKRVFYQPFAEIIHLEGVSHGKDISIGLKSYQKINHQKFNLQWDNELQGNHFSKGTPSFTACLRSSKRKTILFIDHAIPTPDKDAGSKSVSSYIDFFLRRNFHVLLIGDNHDENQPYSNDFRKKGVKVLSGEYFRNNISEWFMENGKYIDYAFLSRPHTSLRWIEPLRAHTHAKVLFYGVDLISRTRARAYRDTKLLEHKKTAQQFKKYEDAIHPLVDVIFYPSQVEVDYLSRTLKNSEIKKIPLYVYEDSMQINNYNPSKRDGILFVGGFRHTPNLDAIVWFIKKIFPKVLKKLPQLKLTIVGSDAPQELIQLVSKNINIKSNLSDEDLNQLLEKTKLSIAPLRFGGGIKGKIVDSLRKGVPVITTEIGAEGLSWEESHMRVSAIESFAENLIELYNNNETLNMLSEAGLNYIKAHFSEQAMRHSLLKYVSDIL